MLTSDQLRYVFVVCHVHEGDQEGKLIGVYSSREKAEAARDRAVRQPGFRDHAEGFQIGCCEIDTETWITERFPSPIRD